MDREWTVAESIVFWCAAFATGIIAGLLAVAWL